MSRKSGLGGWKNPHIGCEAIVEFSSVERGTHDMTLRTVICADKPWYQLLIIEDEILGNFSSQGWFEEDSLELICSNDEKGKNILRVIGF